jgi:exopolyphosphatase/guanosine-5'-triphosphate,3'-diphosphate pyrophosphatase
MPVAILDFGTNTFNLLIAEQAGSGFRVLYDGKQPVKLGKGGINKKVITPDAMERGLAAIRAHMQTISKFGATEIHAYATSAMRNAENGRAFAAMIEEEFGFTTHIIDGEEEAALIYGGIRESVDFGDATAIILDIGGGSNEFIICNADGILWKQSFELGMARIIEMFHLSDPVRPREVSDIEAYYAQALKPLLEAVDRYRPSMLVGASGTFDTLAAMAAYRFGISAGEKSASVVIAPEYYREIHRSLLHSTTEERLNMPGMEPVRVEMIVPATIFINFVYHSCQLESITQSRYALKEGVMARLTGEK